MASRDKPWLMRTYSGHSSARASNELYRTNLARGQTGLSVAFDLPTQTGYDPDHPLARGEVGKVGVPVPHLGEMRTLFDGIPLDEMNTSMTINATAMWLLAMYVGLAEQQGAEPARRFRFGISYDDELALQAGLDLQPGRGTARPIGCIRPLADNPFQSHPAGLGEQGRASANEVIAQLQR